MTAAVVLVMPRILVARPIKGFHLVSFLGLIAGLFLLILLAIRGWHLLIAAPLSALMVAVSDGLPLFPQVAGAGQASFVGEYMDGFTGFFKSWFFMFLLGAIFGKAMENSRSAESIARWIIDRIGIKHAALALVAACAVLTYGGVSVFIVAFCVYSMAVSLFKAADLPRRFIPSVIAFGSVTFTMTSAGSPEIQNWIPIQYLDTDPYAGWQVSLIVGGFMALVGYAWMRKMITHAVAGGERYEVRADDNITPDPDNLPPPWVCTLPLACILGVSFFIHEQLGTAALIVALASGITVVYLLNHRFFHNLGQPFSDGASGALIAIANTCAVVGFGAVAKANASFGEIVELLTHLPGGGLVGAALAVSLICGLTGSASGGQTIALPLLAPIYTGPDIPDNQRVDPEALHRVVSIASGGLDSLPHNGYVVTLIRSICGESHRAAYGPLAKLTVVVPFVGTVLAIILFTLL